MCMSPRGHYTSKLGHRSMKCLNDVVLLENHIGRSVEMPKKEYGISLVIRNDDFGGSLFLRCT